MDGRKGSLDAYDPDENREATEYAEYLRKKIEHDFPGKVIFAIAEGSHMRKGWNKLVDALNKIPEDIRSKFVIPGESNVSFNIGEFIEWFHVHENS